MRIERRTAMILLLSSALAPLALAPFARAATVVVGVSARVIRTIVLSKLSDLDLGDAAPGDAPRVIAPGSAGAARLSIQGEPNHSYVIASFPSSVVLSTGSGGSNQSFAVTSLTHDAGSSPRIGADGTAAFSIGATRPALPTSQASGSYSGSFSVTVTY